MMSLLWSHNRWEALDLVNVIAGACLFFAPWYLGFVASSAAAWSSSIVGALVVIASLTAIFSETRSGGHPRAWEYMNLGLATWAVLAPWLLAFAAIPGPRWVSLIVGLVVGVVAIVHLWLPKTGGPSMA